MAKRLDPDQFLRDRRIIICCGSGGVGKTTTAAALGLRAAQLGRDVLVMTIDPARRLAQALGLDALTHEPQPIALALEGEGDGNGDRDRAGTLAALMLDPKSAFDQLVHKHAPSLAAREAILGNRYYQQLAENFGGSRELIGMEQVLVHATADPERLLIVDTPPAQHALDFLDAPQRVLGLVDGSLTEAFLKPYRGIAKAQFQLFRQSSAMTLKFVERLTGANLITELGEFLNAFSVLFDGFRDRAAQVRTLMGEPGTGFLLVCAPEPMSLREVNRFATRLKEESLDALGVLVNRVAPGTLAALGAAGPGLTPETAAQTLQQSALEPRLQTAVAAQLAREEQRIAVELASIEHFLGADAASNLRDLAELKVPEHTHDLHSLDDLARYAAAWQT